MQSAGFLKALDDTQGWKWCTTNIRRESLAAILQGFGDCCTHSQCYLRSRSKTTLLDLCSLNELTGPSPSGLDWLLQWFEKCRCRRPAGISLLSPLLWDTLQPAISPIKWTRDESKDDEIHLQDIEQIEEDFIYYCWNRWMIGVLV